MADKETTTVDTKVEKIEVNLDDIFDAAPGGDSITLPEDEQNKSIFSRKQRKVDTSFLDEPAVKEEKTEEPVSEIEEVEEITEVAETKEVKKEEPKLEINVDEVLGLTDEADEDLPVKRGRKKIDGIADVFNKLIKDDKIVPFDDEKPLEEYSAKDYEELIQANLDERTRAVRNETPKQFFNSLPEELQIAARYVADGGTDLRGLFGALSQVEETKEINPKSEKGQERIITEYLSATGFGTAEEIAEEIDIWKDLGKLEKQATKFKPKLDKMQEKVVAKRLQAQQMKNKQQQQASENYMKNVYNTLKDGKIGETRIDRKTQSLLYNGLVQPSYPSINGKNTNLLGHLLEKYQFVEPNYPLITEALWLLADPKGYKTNLMQKGETKAVEKTVRKLKTAQSQKRSSAAVLDKDTGAKRKASRKLPRGNKNIFKRF
tara:strand:+ start:947 stop:2245 length:1299 start_codon:yes stop_codon:yes gene_type:complete